MTVLIERLGWVLVHSLWQFALVALLAGAIARAMRRSSSAARYGVLVVAMGVMIVVPLVTWLVSRDDLVSRVASAPGPDAVPTNSSGLTPNGTRFVSDPALAAGHSPENVDPESPVASAIPLKVSAIGLTPPARQETLSWSQLAKTTLQPWLAWIVVVWCLGVAVCSLRPLLGWHTLWRLKRVGVSPASEEVLAALRRVSEQLRLRRAVSVCQSTLAQVPVVVGYLRPVILLPVSLMTSLPAEQLEAILAHELAHVRRHDFVVNLLQTLVETFFFYHPAVWWLSHQIRVEREHCCDDLVVASFGNRIEYGRALLAIEELRGRSSVLALGANDGSLLSRIRRIVGINSEHTANERWPAAFIVLVLIGVTCALSMTWSLAAKDELKKELKPDRYVAELPNGVRVEFVGLATMEAEPKTWWKPDGSPLNEAPKYGKAALKPAVATERRGVVRVHGAKSSQDVISNYAGVRMDFARAEDQGTVFCDVRAFPIGKSKAARVEVGLATEPMSPVRVLDAGGTKVPRPADAPADHIAEDIEVEIVVRAKSNDPQTADDARERTWITFEAPIPGHRQMDLDLKLIDKEGKAHDKESVTGTGSDAARRKSTYIFDVPFHRVARFEYRMRLYQYWVTFDNVALNPGELTDVKVKVETIPVEPSELKILNSDGSRARFNHVASASLGFPGEKGRSWFESANKEGLISLAKLPSGTHWLVAAGDSEQRTAFQLRVPTKRPIVEQRLRNVGTFVTDDLSVAATLSGATPEDEVISVEIANESTEPITFSEEDISLTMHPGLFRVFSPRIRNAAKQPLPQIKVLPGNLQTLTIKWPHWVREGLWQSRIGDGVIDEPWSILSEPGKIQVRVNLGNHGAVPGFVTSPQTIIKQPAPAAGAERGTVETRILEELERPTSLTIELLNLSDIVALVAKQHRLPIVIDVAALSELNVRQDILFSRTMKDVKLRHALKTILETFGGKRLALVVEDNVLKITADKSPEAAAAINRANQRIEAELRNTTEIALSDTTLSDVIQYLSDYHDISIQLHPSVQAAVETPITATMNASELADALALILHEAKLSSCIDQGVLLIATPEEIRNRGGPFPRSFAADFAKLEKADASVRWSALLRGVVEESDSAAIPQLTGLLGSDDLVIQRWTARALVPFGNKARAAQPGLEKLTRSKEGRVAFAAWQALIEIGREDLSTLPLLLSALDREDESLTNRSMALIWRFDRKVWRELATKYPTLSIPVRRTLASSKFGDRAFVVLPLSDPDLETRRCALRRSFLDASQWTVSQREDFETVLVTRLKDLDAESRVLAAGQLLNLNQSVNTAVTTILAEASHEPGREVLRRCVASTNFLFLNDQQQWDEPCRSESEVTRNAARQTLAIICRHYQTTRDDHFIIWGSNRDGWRTRLSPLTENPQLGEPIKLKLELDNMNRKRPAKFTFSQTARTSLVVIGPDGREMSPINRERKPSEITVTAETHNPVVLIEELDLAAEYPIKQPGTYLVQWTQDRPGVKSDDGKSLTPNSNVLTVEVAEPTKVGGLKPIEGQVIDSITGKPIDGATVRFRFRKMPVVFRANDKPLAELVFRNVGRFTFELPNAVKGETELFVEPFGEHPDYQTSGTSREGWQNGFSHKTTTDSNGRYRMVVPAGHGRGRIYVIPNHAAAVSRAITPEFGDHPGSRDPRDSLLPKGIDTTIRLPIKIRVLARLHHDSCCFL